MESTTTTATSKPPKTTKSPAEWQKRKRLHPHQRFRMYNPLHMDFYLKPSFAKVSESSFDDKRNNSGVSPMTLRVQAKQIIQDKKKMISMINQATHTSKGFIQTEGAEKIFNVTQEQIRHQVNQNTSKKYFELSLEEHAPYKIDYTRNGSYLCLGGSRGHLALLRWKDFRLVSEEYFGNVTNNGLTMGDYIFDVKFCMNESMLACAQREAVYIYNAKCVETHVLKRSLPFPLKLDFLPYHFLLTSIGVQGKLAYFDVSVGRRICLLDTTYGECDMMCSNQSNGVIHLGHTNGMVTLWTPTNVKPVVSMLCHKSPIRGLAVDHVGYKMATSDSLGNLKVWDLRTYKELITHRSNTMITSCTFSQKGLLAFSTGHSAVIWNVNRDYSPCKEIGKDELLPQQQHLYLRHVLNRRLIRDLKFCPYEDILGIGHSAGFTSIVVPGSGEPNFDVFEANPFETRRQSKNRVVYQLLDKLRPDMIQLDSNFIGNLPNSATYIQDPDRKPVDEEHSKKFARKNLTRSVKKGYRGVIKRRYHKYQHMKDLQHRQDKFKMTIKHFSKMVKQKSKNTAQQTKKNLVRKLTTGKKGIQKAPSALQRFSSSKKKPGSTQKLTLSRFTKKKHVYF